MSTIPSSPWHRASYDAFVHEGLPVLLSARLPLDGYEAVDEDDSAVVVRIRVGTGARVGSLSARLPRPDTEGVFHLDDDPTVGRDAVPANSGPRHAGRVVVPLVMESNVGDASVRCVGEQLLADIDARLGMAPGDLAWDDALVASWLPLEQWVLGFLRSSPTSQWIDDTNWLARQTHLRRVRLNDDQDVLCGQDGYLCPVETPEGPNVARVGSIAFGARIEDAWMVAAGPEPADRLGLTARMVPLLEHDDPIRALMGVNMMRQWLMPPDPEPALVATGLEPPAAGLWCGRNLLTAFVPYGIGTYEDAILVSESAAAKLAYPSALASGDKLSNRHGTKGTVSRIVPDDEMPHLPDGTPAEIVFSFNGLFTRLNFGQVREAVLGRIAMAEGRAVVAPPFGGMTSEWLKERLKADGLPEDGMERLRMGREGPELELRSTVGWVYWGKLVHTVTAKLHSAVGDMAACDTDPLPLGLRPQRYSELEFRLLLDREAHENLREFLNTRAAERADAASLAARVAAGPVAHADAPTPQFARLQSRLALVGIGAELSDGRLRFGFAPPPDPALELARPIPHPWLRETLLRSVGRLPGRELAALERANESLRRLLTAGGPSVLLARAEAEVCSHARAYLNALVSADDLRPAGQVLFSARSVISPGAGLSYDEIGLPEAIAWDLLGPLVARRVGGVGDVLERTDRSREALAAAMDEVCVLVNRAPSVQSTSFIAVRPRVCAGHAIRLHPMCCPPLNADFDGDQVAVHLPVTEAAQAEAWERLSAAAHVRRDPSLLDSFRPTLDAMWGLVWLSLGEDGRAQVRQILGRPACGPQGFITADALVDAASELLREQGAEAALGAFDRLTRLGLDAAQRSGASLSPFVGMGHALPGGPPEDPAQWRRYCDEMAERVTAMPDFGDSDLGPQLLAVLSRSRGNMGYIASLLGFRADTPGKPPIRGAIRDGLAASEYFSLAGAARQSLVRVFGEITHLVRDTAVSGRSSAFTALARAMRARRPGVVFARAAAIGEVDPLTDKATRLLVGLV